MKALNVAIKNVVDRNHTKWKIVFVCDKFNRMHNPAKKIDDTNDILMFKKIYSVLYETTKLTENCFGWSLLAIISYTFIDLTSNMYWFSLALLKLDARFNVVDCTMEIVPSVIALSSLIYSSYEMGRVARAGINLAIRLYTNTTSDYNVLVKEYLMQMYHEKIENSANDFFLVDSKLFSSVSDLYNRFIMLQ
jgi:7tm Chemosensory receptor